MYGNYCSIKHNHSEMIVKKDTKVIRCKSKPVNDRHSLHCMIIRYNRYSNSLRSRSVIKQSIQFLCLTNTVRLVFVCFVQNFGVKLNQIFVIMQFCHSLTLFLTPAGIVQQMNSQKKTPNLLNTKTTEGPCAVFQDVHRDALFSFKMLHVFMPNLV